MKKSTFSALAIMVAVALTGSVTSCNKSNNENAKDSKKIEKGSDKGSSDLDNNSTTTDVDNIKTEMVATESVETTTVVPDTAKQEQKGFKSNLNIRFVDMEAIMKDYEYAKLERANFEAKDKAIQKEQNELQQQDYNKQAAIMQKAQNNQYQSEEEYNKDMQAYQQWAQTESEKLGKKLQTIQDQYNATNEKLTKAIESYITRYNNQKGYDAILLKNAGLFFNPELDITKEVLQGLNAEYKAKK